MSSTPPSSAVAPPKLSNNFSRIDERKKFVDELREFLDGKIKFWRISRDAINATDEARVMATYYIDAYQSVRLEFVGELLPLNKSEEQTDESQ